MKLLALTQFLVAARSLTTRPTIPMGFAVVARSVLPAASPAAPLVQHLRTLWPERFATESAGLHSSYTPLRSPCAHLRTHAPPALPLHLLCISPAPPLRHRCATCATPCASAAKKACRRKLVLVDGKVGRTAHVASAAAEISVLARVEAGPAPGSGRRALARPEEQLTVLFEDDHLAVVAKPAGVDVPALRTLLAASLAPSQAAEHEPLWRPQHVHRLDKPTRVRVL